MPATDSGESMLIRAPFAEPCLDWSVTYKGLINYMAQHGFTSTRVTDSQLYYDLVLQGRVTESVVLHLDTAQCYRAADVMVSDYTVSTADVRKYLGQQYQQTGATATETFYRSKTTEDSILVSFSMVDGKPLISYSKGMN